MSTIRNYQQFENDLYWGWRLYLLRIKHNAHGFRGNAKGAGFSAYLKAEGAPRRKAYRLIRFYFRIYHIWQRIHAENQDLEKEIFKPEDLKQILAGFKRLARKQAKEAKEHLGQTTSVTNGNQLHDV